MSASPASAFGARTTAEEVVAGLDLSGRTILVTGANSGLGLETARVLGARGAHVIAAARTEDKAAAALDALQIDGTPLACELSDLGSVRAAVAAVHASGRALDAIVANAGIMALPEPVRREGVELQLLTNHVGHFALVTGLIDALTSEGRVVVVSSGAHFNAPPEGIRFDDLGAERHYHPWQHYGQSKLANILFARALARRLAGTGRVANALHPGVIETNLLRHQGEAGPAILDRIGRDRLKSLGAGAATQTLLAVHPSTAAVSGAYYADCQPAETLPLASDEALGERLWAWTEAWVGARA